MDVITLTQQLIQKPSVTPFDAGCQDLLKEILLNLEFSIQHFDSGRVKNIWARYGTKAPLFIFAGHTDVVPTGDLQAWQSPPFDPQIREGHIFGRGACDMKGGLAAMIIAVDAFLKKNSAVDGSIGFLITSAEEGDDYEDGTPYVMQQLSTMNQLPHYCIVGEPSSETLLGDTIKIGRRGSLTGHLKIRGKQGHVAYPQYAENPIHLATNFLNEITRTIWDDGNDYFPPTSFQITKINADSGGNNVIPGELDVTFNFRYSPMSSHNELRERVKTILKNHALNYEIEWHLSGLPFLTQTGPLLSAAQKAIHETCMLNPILSTSGGTSDGRFIAPYGIDVIELGLINKTIHQINESTSLGSLHQLCLVYERILELIFS